MSEKIKACVGTAITILVVGFVSLTMATSQVGCLSSQTVKTAGHDVAVAFDCAGSSIKAQIPGLLSLVALAITGVNVLVDVTGLISKYGEAVIACTALQLATPAQGATLGAAELKSVQSAQALIKLKGWTFVPAPAPSAAVK